MVTGWRVPAVSRVVAATSFTPERLSRKPRTTESVLETDTRCLTVTRTASGVTGVLLSAPKPVEEESRI